MRDRQLENADISCNRVSSASKMLKKQSSQSLHKMLHPSQHWNIFDAYSKAIMSESPTLLLDECATLNLKKIWCEASIGVGNRSIPKRNILSPS